MNESLTLASLYKEKFWVVDKIPGLAIEGQFLKQNGVEGHQN